MSVAALAILVVGLLVGLRILSDDKEQTDKALAQTREALNRETELKDHETELKEQLQAILQENRSRGYFQAITGATFAWQGDDVAQAKHLLVSDERREAAVEPGLDDEQVEGVAAEIERRDAHESGERLGSAPTPRPRHLARPSMSPAGERIERPTIAATSSTSAMSRAGSISIRSECMCSTIKANSCRCADR